MTDRERAELVAAEWQPWAPEGLVRKIEQAIRETREACAKVAEEYDPHQGNPGYERAITGSIAAAIRGQPAKE